MKFIAISSLLALCTNAQLENPVRAPVSHVLLLPYAFNKTTTLASGSSASPMSGRTGSSFSSLLPTATSFPSFVASPMSSGVGSAFATITQSSLAFGISLAPPMSNGSGSTFSAIEPSSLASGVIGPRATATDSFPVLSFNTLGSYTSTSMGSATITTARTSMQTSSVTTTTSSSASLPTPSLAQVTGAATGSHSSNAGLSLVLAVLVAFTVDH